MTRDAAIRELRRLFQPRLQELQQRGRSGSKLTYEDYGKLLHAACHWWAGATGENATTKRMLEMIKGDQQAQTTTSKYPGADTSKERLSFIKDICGFERFTPKTSADKAFRDLLAMIEERDARVVALEEGLRELKSAGATDIIYGGAGCGSKYLAAEKKASELLK